MTIKLAKLHVFNKALRHMNALSAVMVNDEETCGLRRIYPSISIKNSLMNDKHYQLSDLLLHLQLLRRNIVLYADVNNRWTGHISNSTVMHDN